jgi:hypothetical protein
MTMQYFFRTLKDRPPSEQLDQALASGRREELQVVVPNSVVLPLPKSPGDEICIPASINGRDLSTGRL